MVCVAAEACAAETASVLIAAGADVNAKDNNGETPLAIAMHRGSQAVATVLSNHMN